MDGMGNFVGIWMVVCDLDRDMDHSCYCKPEVIPCGSFDFLVENWRFLVGCLRVLAYVLVLFVGFLVAGTLEIVGPDPA